MLSSVGLWCTARVPTEPCPRGSTAECLHIDAPASIELNLPANTSSLVVIGAHHFGGDPNDPLFHAVKRTAWASVLLVEASPPIADQLKARVKKSNPTPRVPAHRVRAVHQGIGPSEQESVLPFYSFAGAPGLPFWSTQVGTFNRAQMDKIVVHMSRAAHRDTDFIKGLVHTHPVRCTSLLSLLRREAVDELGLLLIDTEGLDCEIVAAQDWASPEWCANSPAAIVFEWKHCTPEAYSKALRALERSEECPDLRGGAKSSPFRVVTETEESLSHARASPLLEARRGSKREYSEASSCPQEVRGGSGRWQGGLECADHGCRDRCGACRRLRPRSRC